MLNKIKNCKKKLYCQLNKKNDKQNILQRIILLLSLNNITINLYNNKKNGYKVS